MGNEGRGGKKLSVARELLLLAANAHALVLAAERNLDSRGESHHDFTLAMAGSLLLLQDRLRLLERVVMGAANPSLILCPSNQADSSEEGPGIVREWSHEEEVQHLEAEWRGARYRRDLARQAPSPKSVVITDKKPAGSRSN